MATNFTLDTIPYPLNNPIFESNMSETQLIRYHERLQDYWEQLRGSRAFPSENEINPDDLLDIWPSCFLISIDDVTRRLGYRYSYLGESLIEAYGDDISNPDVALKLVSSVDAPMVSKFDEVRKTRQPVIDESQFVNLKLLNIRYRTCLLPLGIGEREITHIIGCMRWKAY
jgi:hypothetical protein